MTALAARLPFAYYPSTAEIELAFDKSADLLQEHLGGVFRPAADTTALKPETLKPGLTWATYDGKKLPDDLAKATPTAKAAPLPPDFTLHITNCQVLPWTTWATSTLDLEQPYRAGKPFPPDYTRAMTSGRHTGVVAHGMYPLANYNDYRDKKTSAWTEEEALADWGMYQVHEVRSSFFADWRQEWKQWRRFRDAMRSAGYGHPQARIINYWQPADPVSVRGAKDVAWLAIVPPPDAKVPAGVLGAVLLQSYADGGTRAAVTWKGANVLLDHLTRRAVGSGGENVPVDLPGRFATRLLWALERPEAAP